MSLSFNGYVSRQPSTDTTPGRIVVLISGNGSNLQALIDACADGSLDAEIVGVISNRPQAFGLTRAERAQIPTTTIPHVGRPRAEYDSELARIAAGYSPELVVLAGWDRILTPYFVGQHTTINLHPSKPGVIVGLGAIQKTFDAWQNGKVAEGGVMVHYVPDEGVDIGPVIVTESVPLFPNDTLADFEARVHETEHRLIVAGTAKALTNVLAMRV